MRKDLLNCGQCKILSQVADLGAAAGQTVVVHQRFPGMVR
jgi:hypothetical protein